MKEAVVLYHSLSLPALGQRREAHVEFRLDLFFDGVDGVLERLLPSRPGRVCLLRPIEKPPPQRRSPDLLDLPAVELVSLPLQEVGVEMRQQASLGIHYNKYEEVTADNCLLS